MAQEPLNNEAILSKTITFLRFPLIAVVLASHVGLEDVVVNGASQVSAGLFPVYGMLHHLVARELTRVAVALFFFISGLLFFRHTDFSLGMYARKLRSRARTILVPYLFWNIVVLCLLLLSQRFFPSAISGQEKPVAGYGWQDWLGLFWNHRDGMPICYQFWFIRDLMVAILASPLIYWLLRHGKSLGLLALGMLWLLNIWLFLPGLGVTAFFFFSFGAFFSIHRRNPVADFRPLRIPATAAYLALAGFNTWLWQGGQSMNPYMHRIGIVAGLVAVVAWTAEGIRSGKLAANPLLASSSFFVYAYHGKPAAVAVKCCVRAFAPMKEWSMVLGYVLIPTILIGMGIALYALSRRYFPRFTAVITGGR